MRLYFVYTYTHTYAHSCFCSGWDYAKLFNSFQISFVSARMWMCKPVCAGDERNYFNYGWSAMLMVRISSHKNIKKSLKNHAKLTTKILITQFIIESLIKTPPIAYSCIYISFNAWVNSIWSLSEQNFFAPLAAYSCLFIFLPLSSTSLSSSSSGERAAHVYWKTRFVVNTHTHSYLYLLARCW
jgi:hypothetical protein